MRFDVCSYFFAKNLALGENFLSPTLNIIQPLFINSSNSLYYGLNALSHNLIMADRKKLKNPNGLILGTPGSGKSFSAKREMANAILVTDDDVIICDPEGEVRHEVA